VQQIALRETLHINNINKTVKGLFFYLFYIAQRPVKKRVINVLLQYHSIWLNYNKCFFVLVSEEV